MKKYYSKYAYNFLLIYLFYTSYKFYIKSVQETWLKNDIKDLYKEVNDSFIKRNKKNDLFDELFNEIEFNRN